MCERRRTLVLLAVLGLFSALPSMAQTAIDRADDFMLRSQDHMGHGKVVGRAIGAYDWIIEESDVFGIEVRNTLLVNAVERANGTDAGLIYYRQRFLDNDFSFLIRVTCFDVYDRNRAKVGGIVEWTNDPSVEGLYGWFQAIEGKHGLPAESTLVGFGDEQENAEFCASPATPRFGPWAVEGRLDVHAKRGSQNDDDGDDDDDDGDD